ncbi:MAG: alpha/beta hydrolase [Halieaceae bacterium]|nr:alpha/beta hydrolase [Halieaceae bacterium]
MTSITGEPVSWTVDGLTYAGLAWGRADLPPVIALHGWMDNALSFSRLGPLLKKRRVIALDLSGHGWSSHRSRDASYQLWDDIPQLIAIVDQLTSNRVSLIGHSKGAAIATLLASVLGERCDRLALIDGLLPSAPSIDNPATQLAHFVRDREKYLSRGERVFDNLDEFVAARTRYGFSEDNARTLAPRALEHCKEGYRLRADPRLFGASAVKFSRSDRQAFYRTLSMPVLTIFGEKGFFRSESAEEMIAEAAECIPNFRSTILPGTHHLHLESDVEQVAWRIDSFIESGS